ncbi:MAG TPA: hypothetical protein VF981_06525 [Gemmatimonadaceae bacterium]
MRHPLTTQARSLSARYRVLELGGTLWRWSLVCTSSRTRKQVEHPELATRAGWLRSRGGSWSRQLASRAGGRRLRIVRSRGDRTDPAAGLQFLPSRFVELIPFLLTMVALTSVVGRAVSPSASGRVGAAN